MQTSALIWAGHTFDVVRSISVVDAAQLSQHPLEDGALIADNIQQLPTPVQADVVISDLPGDGTAYRKGRGDEAYLALLGDLAKGTEATLITADRAYGNMVLTGLSRSRSTPEGAARLSLRWDPVRRVSSQEVAVPLPHTTAIAAGKVSVGKVTPEEPPAPTTEKATSILALFIGG